MRIENTAFVSRIQRTAVGGFLIVAGLILALTVAELGTRWLYPVLRSTGDTWANIDQRLDQSDVILELARGNQAAVPAALVSTVAHPYLGFVMDSEVELTSRDGTSVRPYSELGFLNGCLPPPNRDGAFIIGVSGGSVAAQFMTVGSGAPKLRELLQTDPYFQGKQIEFQNYALPGYKQPQELMTLNYLLVLGAQFDMWISINGFNDVVLPVIENAPAHVSIVYPRSWHLLNQRVVDLMGMNLRSATYAAAHHRDRLRSIVAAEPLRSSAFVRAWWDIADRALEEDTRALAGQVRDWQQQGTDGQSYGPVSLDGAGLDSEFLARRAMEIWKQSSRQMAKLCEANDIEYIQFVQPNQYFKGSKVLNAEEQRFAWTRDGYQPYAEMAYPLLVESLPSLQVEGVPVIDLTMIYRDEERTVYIDSCCHVNDLGNEILGQYFAEEILRAVHAKNTVTGSE